MTGTPPAVRALALVLALAGPLAAAGCGWVEWPPPGQQRPRAVSAQPPQAAPGGGSKVLVGAEAVVVGKGDSVYALSRRHRVSVRAIIEANRLVPPYHLAIGQRIVLPRARVHLVERGDTLSEISRRYGVGMYALARANGLPPPYTILVGQPLRIPGAAFQQLPATKPKVEAKVEPKPEPKAEPKAEPPAAAPAPPPVQGKGFLWPVEGKVVSSFGAKAKGLRNDGINIAAPRGSPVRAAENGVVAYAGNELRGFGNLLLVKHAGGWITAYAHNDTLLVERGQKVRKGQVIAKVGSTGTVRSPQLHFELRRGKRAVDPRKYLRAGTA